MSKFNSQDLLIKYEGFHQVNVSKDWLQVQILLNKFHRGVLCYAGIDQLE